MLSDPPGGAGKPAGGQARAHPGQAGSPQNPSPPAAGSGSAQGRCGFLTRRLNWERNPPPAFRKVQKKKKKKNPDENKRKEAKRGASREGVGSCLRAGAARELRPGRRRLLPWGSGAGEGRKLPRWGRRKEITFFPPPSFLKQPEK